ncbi:MAG: DUF2845 domain-containing protein [Desulfobacterales bacterium]
MKKFIRVIRLLAALVMLTGFTTAVYALDDVSNMNCGDVIAETGDQQFAFQQKCGPPTATEQNGQVWIYDRRPDDFVYYVTFTEGQVERIQVGGND